MLNSNPGEQDAKVVVDLGDRSHRRAGVLARCLLLDRDRRRKPTNVLVLWLLHLAEELPRIGGQTFDVSTLAFGVEGIEGEGGFA